MTAGVLTADQFEGMDCNAFGEGLRSSVEGGAREVERNLRFGVLKRVTGRVIDKALNIIATDPDKADEFLQVALKLGADFTPFLGPLKKLADAREFAREGQMEEALILATQATPEMILDIATCGASAIIPDEILTSLTTARHALRTSSFANLAEKLDVVSAVCKQLLKNQTFRSAMMTLVTFGLEEKELDPDLAVNAA